MLFLYLMAPGASSCYKHVPVLMSVPQHERCRLLTTGFDAFLICYPQAEQVSMQDCDGMQTHCPFPYDSFVSVLIFAHCDFFHVLIFVVPLHKKPEFMN